MADCKCGCGQSTKGTRVFIDKRHQLAWMAAGGAAELNSLQPLEAKARGGATAGKQSAANGKLLAAGKKGGQKAHEIALEVRQASSKDSHSLKKPD